MAMQVKRFGRLTERVGTGDSSKTEADETPGSDDPASTILTGFPGTRVVHSETGAQGTDDPASGVLTGYPGRRTPLHVHGGTHGLDDPAAGVLTGYPGARTNHTENGGQAVDDPAAGVLTGYPGIRTDAHVDRTPAATPAAGT